MYKNGKANSKPSLEELLKRQSEISERHLEAAKQTSEAARAYCRQVEKWLLLKTPRPKNGRVKIPKELMKFEFLN